MYRKHFALTHFPFDLTLEPEALFASATLAEAEARLQHLLGAACHRAGHRRGRRR